MTSSRKTSLGLLLGCLVGVVASSLGAFGTPLHAASGSGSRSITGRVTSEGALFTPQGGPVKDICVRSFFDEDGVFAGSTRTLKDGTYALRRMPVAGYRIYFWDCLNALSTWVPEWYDDATLERDAKVVQVTDDADTTGIDAQLRRLP